MSVKVAVIGATGVVGRQMVAELDACMLPMDLSAFASPQSEGQQLTFRGRTLSVKAFNIKHLKGVDYVLMSAGGSFSREWAKAINDQGAIVIDNSSAWRMDSEVPLIVPEVNADRLADFKRGIIANPNCSTIQLVVSLQPLLKNFGLKMVQVATYQSVSGAGQKGIDELNKQLKAVVAGEKVIAEKFPLPIANNVIPAIDVMVAGGHCYEEEKMVRETRKILNLGQLNVLATTVRVPTLHCHCEAIMVELEREVSRDEAVKAMQQQSGLKVEIDDAYQVFPQPLTVAFRSDVVVSRIRLPLDLTRSCLLQYWNVSDNLMKGAATNAVQILQALVSR